ncbi:PRD domain-containing protein [Corynebacterium sp. sy017]|uniref:PRD domain-containing protein n=1 Tax=unclassified Corynebacterium TaxID=2624378 RepID=UPI001185AC4B|nr:MULTISPECIES: PRD domain-containing protein [unclassified Corynebacterium]MBP3088785.1 PRD domain-containing protein [Corynebacterium sp. sy017]TSD91128.1 PRD domain-containing protein [Corynebacterium sp. SY003]
MDVIRVLNNNAVLCQGKTGQAILLGRGLGFGKRLGDVIDTDEAEQVFVPNDLQPMPTLVQMVADIPLDMIELGARVARLAGSQPSQSFILGLGDHISFAVERVKQSMSIDFPLRWEVQQLYPHEVRLGHKAIELIHDATGVRLPEEEAFIIAMRFVDASIVGGDVHITERITAKLSMILGIVAKHVGELDPHSTAVARFITHLRYLFARLARGEQASTPFRGFAESIAHALPRAYAIAEEIACAVAEQGDDFGADEIAYVAMHIGRLEHSTRQKSDISSSRF